MDLQRNCTSEFAKVSTDRGKCWSICRVHLRLMQALAWLNTDGLYGQLLGGPVSTEGHFHRAMAADVALLSKPLDSGFWGSSPCQPIFLGEQAFVEQLSVESPRARRHSVNAPRGQRRPMRSFSRLLMVGVERDRALYGAYAAGRATLTQLTREAGVSVHRVTLQWINDRSAFVDRVYEQQRGGGIPDNTTYACQRGVANRAWSLCAA